MPLDVWTTSAFPTAIRFDEWRQAVNRNYLEWNLESAPEGPFGARMRQRTLDGIRVVDCYCAPCSGWRRRPQIRGSDGAYFGILFQLRGREALRQGRNEAVLTTGDFVMWDSEREMEFRVMEPLHKISLLIPKIRMQGLLRDAESLAGTIVRDSNRTGGIAAEALRRLARDMVTIDDRDANSVIEPVLSLLSTTLATRRRPEKASLAHQVSFQRFCRYIELNLGESGLTPAAVAAEHGVSLRYLHLIFAKHETSFGRFLRQTRLARCHRELSQTLGGTTITEIAFRWGFNDMAHFSRAFKTEFGLSPRLVSREGRCVGAGDRQASLGTTGGGHPKERAID